jgi:hypothetical protein
MNNLAPWSRLFLERLIDALLVKKVQAILEFKKIDDRLHKSTPLDSMPSQMNLVKLSHYRIAGDKGRGYEAPTQSWLRQ